MGFAAQDRSLSVWPEAFSYLVRALRGSRGSLYHAFSPYRKPEGLKLPDTRVPEWVLMSKSVLSTEHWVTGTQFSNANVDLDLSVQIESLPWNLLHARQSTMFLVVSARILLPVK